MSVIPAIGKKMIVNTGKKVLKALVKGEVKRGGLPPLTSLKKVVEVGDKKELVKKIYRVGKDEAKKRIRDKINYRVEVEVFGNELYGDVQTIKKGLNIVKKSKKVISKWDSNRNKANKYLKKYDDYVNEVNKAGGQINEKFNERIDEFRNKRLSEKDVEKLKKLTNKNVLISKTDVENIVDDKGLPKGLSKKVQKKEQKKIKLENDVKDYIKQYEKKKKDLESDGFKLNDFINEEVENLKNKKIDENDIKRIKKINKDSSLYQNIDDKQLEFKSLKNVDKLPAYMYDRVLNSLIDKLKFAGENTPTKSNVLVLDMYKTLFQYEVDIKDEVVDKYMQNEIRKAKEKGNNKVYNRRPNILQAVNDKGTRVDFISRDMYKDLLRSMGDDDLETLDIIFKNPGIVKNEEERDEYEKALKKRRLRGLKNTFARARNYDFDEDEWNKIEYATEKLFESEEWKIFYRANKGWIDSDFILMLGATADSIKKTYDNQTYDGFLKILESSTSNEDFYDKLREAFEEKSGIIERDKDVEN